MPQYTYQALCLKGKKQSGQIDAENEQQAAKKLQQQNLNPINIERQTLDDKPRGSSIFKRRLTAQTKLLFTRQVGSLLASGIPLIDALDAIVQQDQETQGQLMLGPLCTHLAQHIREGSSFADSLALWGDDFDSLYRAQIAAGESSGRLAEILTSLTQHLETQLKLKHKVRLALLYPGILCTMAFAIVALLLTTVMPKLLLQFKDSAELPLATRVLLSLSETLSFYGIPFLILMCVASGFYVFYRRRGGKFSFKRSLADHLPYLRRFSHKLDRNQFLQTLSVLVSAGLPASQALNSSKQVLRSKAMREGMANSETQLQDGASLNAVLKDSAQFTVNNLLLIRNGEESGQLADMLGKAAAEEQQELERAIDLGLAVFEPIAITIMGAVVFAIVLAILLPIMQLNQLAA